VNHYGRLAMTYWQEHRPDQLEAIGDTETFFGTIGEQIQSAVTAIRDELLARSSPSVTEIEGASAQATASAEEIVFAEMLAVTDDLGDQSHDPAREHYRALLSIANAAMSDSD
jgi:hypothetical protein